MREIPDLIGEIDTWTEVSTRLIRTIDDAVDRGAATLGRTELLGVAIAGLVENYYTAVETLLYRAAQCFGNHLDPAHWHAALLHRMTVAVPDTRPAVLSNRSAGKLDELMRFRHFKRYYFQLEWDWDRLDHMVKTIRQLQPILTGEFQAFRSFLRSVADAAGDTADGAPDKPDDDETKA